jgi:Fe-S-cluster containining protein
MKKTDRMANVEPVKLKLDSKFTFKCHKEVKCFTKCCRGINIVLTPYDIIRLKNRLQLTSEEFLVLYTEPQLLEKTDLPVVTLKLMDDDVKSCPYVTDKGCIVYEDRPTTCRYYPLGFVNEPHCLGFDEKKEWTIREWRQDQGVDIHDDINADWTDLIVRKRSFPPNLSEESKKIFFLASYNIDKFRQFVFESSFLKRYDIDDATVERIKENEIALLAFGLKWLKDVLFKEGKFNLKKNAGVI